MDSRCLSGVVALYPGASLEWSWQPVVLTAEDSTGDADGAYWLWYQKWRCWVWRI